MNTHTLDRDLHEQHLTTADLAGRTQQAESQTEAPLAQTDRQAQPPLFSDDEADNLRERWHGIQAAFVDEPRTSVEKADELVATAIKRLAEVFADERNKLERDWSQGQDASTEDLRQALRRYRSFFDRLLSV